MTFLCCKFSCPLQPTAPGQKPLHYVDTPVSLQACLEDLSSCDTIAFDLEFDSHRHSYGVTLCLVQVATTRDCYVIDPFAPIVLDGLYKLFEDERITKIMHSPGEDLRLLHGLQCFPKNLFDTEVTARLLNYEQTSLAAMLQEKLGHSMCKRQQRSNWLKRPLTQEQLVYAADDVAFLHELKEILGEEARQKALMPYVLEEQAALSTTIYQAEPKEHFLKSADLRTLSPYEQYVLNALFIYRDELARQFNRPAYQVLDEPLLRSLASGSLQPEDLPGSRGLYGGFNNAAFAERLAERIRVTHAEAGSLGLARALPPRLRVSNAERVDREAANRDKEEKFAPVQQALVKRFGEHAARFILSNGTVNDLLKRVTSISSLKRPYKRALILATAKELGIDLSSYE
jgi:ribonuclease D